MDIQQARTAQEFRQRADDLRKIAATSSQATIEDLFLALADQYEKLAGLLSGARGNR
jgi:hypothetical protein